MGKPITSIIGGNMASSLPKNVAFELFLEKVAEKFGRFKYLLYLCITIKKGDFIMEQTILDEFTYLLFYRCPDGRCSHSYTRLNECYHEMEMFILTEFIPANNQSTDLEVHKDEFSITCKLDGKEYVFSVVAYKLDKQLDINKLSAKYML